MNQQIPPAGPTIAQRNIDRKVRYTSGECPHCNTFADHKKINRDTLKCLYCDKKFDIYIFSPSLEDTSVVALLKGNPKPLIKSLKAGNVSFVKNKNGNEYISESEHIVIDVDEDGFSVEIDGVIDFSPYGITREMVVEVLREISANITALEKYILA